MSPDREFALWFDQYRVTLARAFPWRITYREYLERYRFFLAMHEALASRGGDPVGNRRTPSDG